VVRWLFVKKILMSRNEVNLIRLNACKLAILVTFLKNKKVWKISLLVFETGLMAMHANILKQNSGIIFYL
jgi:hypothetical protein